MLYLFDNLPLDMIQYEIFPYLDYNSRVIANNMLPPQDKIRRPLKKNAALQFALQFATTKIRIALDKQTKSKGNGRIRLTLQIWRNPKYMYLLAQYKLSFRETVIHKAMEFMNLESHSKHVKREFHLLCSNAIKDMETKYPYIGECNVSYSKNNEWSAVHV